MKKIIMGSLVAFVLVVSLIWFFHSAHVLHNKMRIVQSEYHEFMALKESFQKGIPKSNQNLLKASEELVENLGLKSNVEHLKLIDHCIEISLKDLPQASLIEFLKKLDSLPSFRILKSNFVSNSSGELGLTLVLVSLSTQRESAS